MKQEILKLEGQWQTWDKWNTLGQVSPCTFEPGDGFAHLKAKGLWTEVRGGVFTPIQSEKKPLVSQLARTPRLWKLFFENPSNHAKNQWTKGELKSCEWATL